MRCGKTTLLGIIAQLCFRALSSSNLTPAVVFRACDICPLTVVLDEADSFAGNDEGLRGLINSGHTRTAAFALRMVPSPDGQGWVLKRFSTWGAFAIAAIGQLPATRMDCGVIIKMKSNCKQKGSALSE